MWLKPQGRILSLQTADLAGAVRDGQWRSRAQQCCAVSVGEPWSWGASFYLLDCSLLFVISMSLPTGVVLAVWSMPSWSCRDVSWAPFVAHPRRHCMLGKMRQSGVCLQTAGRERIIGCLWASPVCSFCSLIQKFTLKLVLFIMVITLSHLGLRVMTCGAQRIAELVPFWFQCAIVRSWAVGPVFSNLIQHP